LIPKTGQNASLLSKEVYDVIKKNAVELDEAIIYDRILAMIILDLRR
jgi:ribonucleoside-diphosphate reductase alpha chain